MGTAVRWKRERIFSEHQQEQGEPDARPETARREGGARAAARSRGRPRRELLSWHDGAAGTGLRDGLREASSSRVLLDLRIRADRTAPPRARLRRRDAG